VTAGKYIRPAPAGGPSLTETTARLRARLDEHAQKDVRGGRSKRPSFRPVPLAELAPAIRQRNDAAAERSAEHDLRDAAARELLIACDFIGSACDDDALPLNRDAIKTFTQAVAEVCHMMIEPARAGSPRSDDRRRAMREAVDALMAKIRPEGSP
jgi:hypothetical protein